jgi:transcriptional regulator with XRE-family HTH domain
MTFGELLRDERKRAGKGLGEVARALEVKVSYLSAVELDLRPPLSPARIIEAARMFRADAAPLLRAAAEKKGTFEIDAAQASEKAKEALAALARELPGIADDKWERIQRIVEE